jgi:prepilin-type N-terminal cleavage/methylation domain-containing protein
MLKARAGFTLAEMIVALVLTSVIGAAITGLFITQSRFYDTQEKTSFARGVTRGAMNMVMSEMRMLDRDSAFVDAPTRTRVAVRVPYAMGAVCAATSTGVTFSRMHADTLTSAGATMAGYWYRGTDGVNRNVPATGMTAAAATSCTGLVPPVRVLPVNRGGGVFLLPPPSPAIGIKPGTPLFLYQVVTYEFRESKEVPGRIGLWRSVAGSGVDEELVAPFDESAGFRFYVDDGPVPEEAPPTVLRRITGLELTLDGISERPRADGSFQRVPLTTSVFFRNRRI